jgi:hypothetical protein
VSCSVCLYAEQHEDLWIGFVERVAERAGYPDLKKHPEYLKRGMDNERFRINKY